MRGPNNHFYNELGSRWYEDDGHAIALLKAEAAVKLRYLDALLAGRGAQRILDMGCGAGFVAIPLAAAGHEVVGVDQSVSTLEVARAHAPESARLRFVAADVRRLLDASGSYDLVLALDLLEHVDSPGDVIGEAARLLRPGGRFVYHTFNRTWVSRLVAIHMINFVVRECPPDLHVYESFIKPKELRSMLHASLLEEEQMRGVMPNVWNGGFWRTLLTRRVHDTFDFRYAPTTLAGYVGHARRLSAGI